jgi:hypothetical protein
MYSINIDLFHQTALQSKTKEKGRTNSMKPHKKKSSDWRRCILINWGKKVILGAFYLTLSHSQVHVVAVRLIISFKIPCLRFLHFLEEKKAEQVSFETELVAGRLQEELVSIFQLSVCWMCLYMEPIWKVSFCVLCFPAAWTERKTSAVYSQRCKSD